MSTRRAHRQASIGWWIDETIPGQLDDGTVPEWLVSLLPASIDAVAFATWLGPTLAKYRNAINLREAIPSRSQEIAGIRRAVASVDETLSALRNLPPWSRATMMMAVSVRHSERIGATWHEFVQRLATDLMMMRGFMQDAAASLAAARATRGRKTTAPRDELFAAIVRRLRDSGLRAKNARDIALKVLARCEIAIGDDDRTVRRVTGRGGGKK